MEFSNILYQFLSIFISTNQNQAFTQYGIFNNFDIKQSSVPSQVILLVLTKQNEVFSDFKIILRSEQKKTKFINFPYQSVLFSFSKLTNKKI